MQRWLDVAFPLLKLEFFVCRGCILERKEERKTVCFAF